MVLVAHSLAVVTWPEAVEAELAALVADVDALLAEVDALEAELEALDADVEAADSLAAAAVAEFAALVADVDADAASTRSVHLALSVLVLIGCDPLEVCWTIHCQMLLLVVSLTMSLT